MNISEKIKGIINKIEQNKVQCSLDRQTTKISAFSSGNVSKYEFLTGKDVLPEKDFLEKAAAIKIFEYSPLGKELKAQTDIAKKQYQKLDDTFKSNKKEVKTKNNAEDLDIVMLMYNLSEYSGNYSYASNKCPP